MSFFSAPPPLSPLLLNSSLLVLITVNAMTLTPDLSDQHADPDAPAQSEADVLLRALPKLLHPEGLLPRCQVQQEQHGAARQVVQQLQVSQFYCHT